MVGKTELYDAFGELIYAVAKADGLIQEEELTTLKEILSNHSWAKEIEWSFNYERGKEGSIEAAYNKALYTCQEYGPSPEYPKLLELLREIALASDGIDEQEAKVINGFEAELRAKFTQQLQDGKLVIRD